MTDYRGTLNLPKTDFPMQANLAKREPEMLARWERERLYERIQDSTHGRPRYWFVDGPPYANGDIHIGHAVNKILKDLIVKVARLDGFDAPFVPGWDCHGLPIELQVEKSHGKVGAKIDAKAFRRACREYATAQIDRQRSDFRRLGILADWDRPYLTMLPAFEAEELRVLARITERGHLVRGFKPVHWCLDCRSSLAEAEVEYQDRQSQAIDVRFAADAPSELLGRFGLDGDRPVDFVIWTTTPWTLPANQAISVNPAFNYVLAEVPGQHAVVVAEGLLEAVGRRLGIEPVVLAIRRGAVLENAIARHPWLDRRVPIILGEHVTLDAGTGLVHTAPAHGAEDYAVGLQYHLAVDNPVESDGRFRAGTPVLGGRSVREADPIVIATLREHGALGSHETITHSYPHCWRHRTALIFRATPQWFISMEAAGLRTQALAEIARTRWIPSWGENRIREMVAQRPDWCVSRQRFWGVPLALFIDRRTQTMHPRTPDLLRRVADAVEKEGLDAWFESDDARWLGGESGAYERVTDTLDVWFDSGCVHQGMFASVAPHALDHGVGPIADLYLEGSDQHRGWFQSSLLSSVAMQARAPYKAVLTHGFTVDEQGRKMSKSLGNVVAPQKTVQELGADVLRLWVAASDYRGEIAVSPTLLKRMADSYRRLRNTARYLLGNLHDFDPTADAVAHGELLAMDRWALAQAQKLQDDLVAAYRDSEFHQVYQRLHNYCVVDLGGLYLDILKDRLYTLPAASRGRRSAQTALYHIAHALVRWIAPILSFTADEIWRLLPGAGERSVFEQTWHQFPAVQPGTDLSEAQWRHLLAVREVIKKLLEERRVAGEIGGSLDAAVSCYVEGTVHQALTGPGPEARFWFITSAFAVMPSAARTEGAVERSLETGESVWIEVRASTDAKCARCWQLRSDVGCQSEHESLCGRCIENVYGAGETRRFI